MQLAVSEMSDGTFDLYLVALTVSGLLLVILAIGGFFKETRGSRLFSGLIGAAFLGYAFYLFFIFTGGTVWMSYYVFIVPVLVIMNIVRSRKEKTLQDARANHAAEATGWNMNAAPPTVPPAQAAPPPPRSDQAPTA
jgi:fatty acid desaturase